MVYSTYETGDLGDAWWHCFKHINLDHHSVSKCQWIAENHCPPLVVSWVACHGGEFTLLKLVLQNPPLKSATRPPMSKNWTSCHSAAGGTKTFRESSRDLTVPTAGIGIRHFYPTKQWDFSMGLTINRSHQHGDERRSNRRRTEDRQKEVEFTWLHSNQVHKEERTISSTKKDRIQPTHMVRKEHTFPRMMDFQGPTWSHHWHQENPPSTIPEITSFIGGIDCSKMGGLLVF